MTAEAGGEAWQWHGLVLDGTLGRADAGVRPPATSVYPMAWAHAWGMGHHSMGGYGRASDMCRLPPTLAYI